MVIVGSSLAGPPRACLPGAVWITWVLSVQSRGDKMKAAFTNSGCIHLIGNSFTLFTVSLNWNEIEIVVIIIEKNCTFLDTCKLKLENLYHIVPPI